MIAGSLEVQLFANIARLQKDMADAKQVVNSSMGEITKAANFAKTALGTIGVGVSVGAFAALSKHIIDTADNMNDLSQKAGIGIQQLGAWKLAAEQSGASMDTVSKGVKGLSAYIGEHGDKLKKAGISATDASGAMIQLADLFASMPDGVTKTNLAVDLFGKAGMDMIPMLNLGSKGLKEAAEKADEYSRRLAELAPNADRFNDELGELKLHSEAFGMTVASVVIGPLGDFVKLLNDLAAGGKRADSALEQMSKSSSPLLAGMASARRSLAGRPQWSGNGTAWEAAGMDPKTGRTVGSITWDEFDAQTEEFMKAREAEKKAKGLLTGGKKDSRGMTDLERMEAIGRRNQAEAIDSEEEMREIARKRDIESAKAAQREADAANKVRQKYLDLIDPLETYRKQLEEIDRLEALGRENGGLDANQALEARWRVNEAMDAQIDKMDELGRQTQKTSEFARDLGLTFGSAFEDAIVGGRGVSEMLRGIAQDMLRIAARKAVTEPFGAAVSSAVSGIDFGRMFGFSGGGGSISLATNTGLSFAGGGFTGDGSRSGGLDGNGGFLAMLHPQETVIDHASGQAAGGDVININLTIQTGVAQTVRAEVANMLPAITQTVTAAVMDARRRGGAMRSTFS